MFINGTKIFYMTIITESADPKEENKEKPFNKKWFVAIFMNSAHKS